MFLFLKRKYIVSNMEHYYSFAKREHLFTKEEIGKMIGNFLQQSLPAASIGVFFFSSQIEKILSVVVGEIEVLQVGEAA